MILVIMPVREARISGSALARHHPVDPVPRDAAQIT
jgi:hypothetical protein